MARAWMSKGGASARADQRGEMSAVFHLLTLFLGDCPAPAVDATATDASRVTIHTQIWRDGDRFYGRPVDTTMTPWFVCRCGRAGESMLVRASAGSGWLDLTGWWANDGDVFVVEGVSQ